MRQSKLDKKICELFSSDLGVDVLEQLLENEVHASISITETNKIIWNEGRRSLVLDILAITNKKIHL